jgi:hypothetical protein
MPSAMSDIFSTLQDAFGEDTAFLSYAGDIKEMYSHLPQDMILSAVKLVLGIIQSHFRRSEISVNRFSSRESRLGKSYSYDNDFVCISLKNIFEVTMIDIQFCFFSLANTMLRQVFGIPMGSPCSPGYSMAICIYYEKQFKDSLSDFQKLFGFARYFDDLRAFVAFNKNCATSKSIAKDIIVLLAKHCYHESMILIPECADGNQFYFLQSQVAICERKLFFTLHSKNFQALIASQPSPVVNSQSFWSFAGDSNERKR